MNKKITEQQKGTIFLFIISSIIWFVIGIKNNPNDSMLGILLVSIFAGMITSIVLTVLFLIMKRMLNW